MGDPPLPTSLFPFGSCNTWFYFGEIGQKLAFLAGHHPGFWMESPVFGMCADLFHIFFPNIPYPAYLVFCFPFIRNSQMNFMNVGMKHAKSYPGFFFNFVVLPLSLPMRKTFCVTYIKFGTKPLTRAVVSEK